MYFFIYWGTNVPEDCIGHITKVLKSTYEEVLSQISTLQHVWVDE